MQSAIQTIHLTKTYGKNRGIQDVNLDIRPGEIFGFLGPNGAGKSTALRTLTGFMRPTSGQCFIMGIDSHKHPVEAMKNVGNLPNEFSLEDRMTGRQLIGLFARLRGISDTSFANVLAERIQADLDRPMRRLSRGNKQKIGIVQAMFHRPPVVILDEPTGGLDPLVQEQFLDILRESKQQGQTVLFSSHVLSEIEKVADRVAIIRNGDLVAVENPHELTERAVRYVHIHFANAVPEALVRHLESEQGVKNVTAHETSLRFTLHGNVNHVLATISSYPVVTIDIERPSLEEIFLTFYGPDPAGGSE